VICVPACKGVTIKANATVKKIRAGSGAFRGPKMGALSITPPTLVSTSRNKNS
jgi:hypothetical protein